MSMWDKFEGAVDVEGLKEDMEKAAQGGGNFVEVPHGEYEVKINKMFANVSKKGDPMLTIYFRVISGEYDGQTIFYNQLINTGYGLHFACEMLRSFNSSVQVQFNGYSEFEQTINEVFEEVNNQELEFALKTSPNGKFTNYEITNVFK